MTHDELTALVQTLSTKIVSMDAEVAELYSKIEDLEGEVACLKEDVAEAGELAAA